MERYEMRSLPEECLTVWRSASQNHLTGTSETLGVKVKGRFLHRRDKVCCGSGYGFGLSYSFCTTTHTHAWGWIPGIHLQYL